MDTSFTFKTKHWGYRSKKTCSPTFPWPWKLLKVSHILTHSQTHTHSPTHTVTHTFQKNWLPCLTLCHFRRGKNWQKGKGWKIVNATFPTNTTWLCKSVCQTTAHMDVLARVQGPHALIRSHFPRQFSAHPLLPLPGGSSIAHTQLLLADIHLHIFTFHHCLWNLHRENEQEGKSKYVYHKTHTQSRKKAKS